MAQQTLIRTYSDHDGLYNFKCSDKSDRWYKILSDRKGNTKALERYLMQPMGHEQMAQLGATKGPFSPSTTPISCPGSESCTFFQSKISPCKMKLNQSARKRAPKERSWLEWWMWTCPMYSKILGSYQTGEDLRTLVFGPSGIPVGSCGMWLHHIASRSIQRERPTFSLRIPLPCPSVRLGNACHSE